MIDIFHIKAYKIILCISMQHALLPGFDCKYKCWSIETFYKGSVRKKEISIPSWETVLSMLVG